MGARDGDPFRPSLLSSPEYLRSFIPYATPEWWEACCFELGWAPYGGGGLGRSYTECQSMTLGHLLRDLDRVTERRKSEYEQIKNAHSKR